jgi:ferrous iron transport protein A
MTRLETLECGAVARLVSVGGERSFRRRLMEMGLLPGTQVRMVRRTDVGGLLELEVRRSRVTLRRHEANLLLVALG